MKHIYKTIQGWFDFHNIYTEAVNTFNSGSKFIEIGTWKGRSAAYMAVEIINSKKDIKFYCVDTWMGSAEHMKGARFEDLAVVNNVLYDEFLKNIQPISSSIIPLRMTSLEAAASFEDNTIDFIFIDASHDYKNVKADLAAWYPKLKSTGTFAGHDYGGKSVRRAVDEFSTESKLTVLCNNTSWVLKSV